MTPEELAAAVKSLRDLTNTGDTTATAAEMWDRATLLADDLDPGLARIAAACYLLRLIKERHREDVANVERRSAKRERVVSRLRQERQAEWDREDAAEAAAFHARMMGLLTDYSSRLRMQWTSELLQSTFALPDGTMVAWGDATVEDHEARKTMLLQNAQGNLHAAARHQRALDDLARTGSRSLGALMAAA